MLCLLHPTWTQELGRNQPAKCYTSRKKSPKKSEWASNNKEQKKEHNTLSPAHFLRRLLCFCWCCCLDGGKMIHAAPSQQWYKASPLLPTLTAFEIARHLITFGKSILCNAKWITELATATQRPISVFVCIQSFDSAFSDTCSSSSVHRDRERMRWSRMYRVLGHRQNFRIT